VGRGKREVSIDSPTDGKFEISEGGESCFATGGKNTHVGRWKEVEDARTKSAIKGQSEAREGERAGCASKESNIRLAGSGVAAKRDTRAAELKTHKS